MTQVKPHAAFNVVRPDEVAECWNGVLASGDLYETLWACVNSYTAPKPEESEEPCWGMDCVADFWDRFSPDQQEQLNQLAERHCNDLQAADSLEGPIGFDPFNI
jgi:hypothetical protein